jgi:hypothetical protein
MADYSNTTSAAGFTINSTLNSETNTITMVVTAPNGSTATATQQRFSGDTITSSFPSLLAQLQDSGALPAGSFPPGPPAARTIYRALISANNGAIQQADKAEVAARATGTPVAQNPAPPPPTNNATDPAVAPAPNNTPPVQSPSPPALVIPAADAALNKAADDKARADYASASPAEKRAIEDTTRLNANQLGGDETVQDKKLPEPNLAQNAATTNEAAQDKKVPIAEPNLAQNAATTNEAAQDKKVVSGDPPYDRKMADAEYTNNLIPTSGERGPQGLTAAKLDAQSQKTQQDAANTASADDWRVKLSLAPGATYLYKNKGKEGILLPLAATDGVIFPYTPSIQVQYVASYDPTEVTHSNYKFFSYRGSAVDSINITCEFTAQDTKEAEYLLAVIHFFRSVTKMFYGKDQNPKNGTPPPLCYLSGLGTYQFDNHPLAITGFTYSLPTDVDYIRAQSASPPPGVSTAPSNVPSSNSNSVSGNRAQAAGLSPGALANPPVFDSTKAQKNKPTYVPTKISITVTAVPIVTRNDISNNFSLAEYGTGALLRGKQRKSGGGIW